MLITSATGIRAATGSRSAVHAGMGTRPAAQPYHRGGHGRRGYDGDGRCDRYQAAALLASLRPTSLETIPGPVHIDPPV